MKSKLLVLLCIFVSAGLSAQIAWVNEFHYDNGGGSDTGEFFEVFVQTGSTLSSLTLSLYRDVGTVYASLTLDTFSTGDSNSTGTFYSKLISGIQNGGADGWSLSGAGLSTQVFSYEGTFTATEGPANGLSSTDIGVEESGSTAVGAALGLTGTGATLAEFSWTADLNDNPGSINLGQSFSGGAIPEPSTYALIFGGLALGMVIWKRRRTFDSA